MRAMQETQVWSLGQEDPLEQGMTTHARILGASMVLNSNKMKDKNHIIILIHVEKALDKPQQPFMIKNFKKYSKRNVP